MPEELREKIINANDFKTYNNRYSKKTKYIESSHEAVIMYKK